MAQRTAEDVIARIRQEAEEAEDTLRFVRTCREGDEIRQGDVYLYPLDYVPGYERKADGGMQLAPGDSPGSRHIVVGAAATFERPDRFDPLDGPLLRAFERVVLTHPEHADISLPAGWYEVRYQRDYSVDALMPRRVLD